MHDFRITGAQMNSLIDELLGSTKTREQPANEIRTLAEWELALASGGEGAVEWQ